MHLSNSKLKIAVLGTRGFPGVQGGIETHCENLFPQLVKKGCEVVVFTRKPYINPDIDRYKGVNLIPLYSPKNKFLETFFHTFIGVIAAGNLSPDILHVHAIGPSLLIPLARLLGLKVVMTHHGPDYKRQKWGKLAKIILRYGERLGCNWTKGLITISGTISEHIYKIYKKNVTVIPNGVTIPSILLSKDSLKKYGLEKYNYILAVGRFVPEKGFHDLIDAFNQFSTVNFESQNNRTQTANQKYKLVIVGGADHEDEYSLGLKAKANKNDNIVLTGVLSGKPLHELYSHATLFVLPSYYEGLPIALLEAMSYRLSCIASDIPANRDVDLLTENRFFKAGDIGLLAKKMYDFAHRPLTSEEKRIQLNGIAERYNWDNIADKTLGVYKKLFQ